jgi:hypothetical protein
MEAILVSTHQNQLSTFFLAINHIAVYAEALASASAQGMASGAKDFFK